MLFHLHRFHDIEIDVQILIHFQLTLLAESIRKIRFLDIPRSIYLSGILARNWFNSSVSLSRYLNVFCIINKFSLSKYLLNTT